MLSTITAAPLVRDERGDVAPARKVVVLVAAAETQDLLRRWCEDNGFNLAASFGGAPRPAEEFEFHLTLFATVGESTLPNQTMAIDNAYAVPAGFAAFGERGTTPVLLVDDPDADLDILRADWLAAADAEPTYSDFRPHVSLSYAWNGEPALNDLVPPDAVLVFDRLEVRTLPSANATKSCAVSVCVDEMQRWKAAFDELAPRPTPEQKQLLRDRLARFAGDLLDAAAIDGTDVDRAAFTDLIEQLERLSTC